MDVIELIKAGEMFKEQASENEFNRVNGGERKARTMTTAIGYLRKNVENGSSFTDLVDSMKGQFPNDYKAIVYNIRRAEVIKVKNGNIMYDSKYLKDIAGGKIDLWEAGF